MIVTLNDDDDNAELDALLLAHGVRLHTTTVERIYDALCHLSDDPPAPGACYDAPPEAWEST